MTSREAALERIETRNRGGLYSLIEENIGNGRDWRTNSWTDGKLHVSFLKGRISESEITSACNEYTALGWTITRTTKYVTDRENRTCDSFVDLIFE